MSITEQQILDALRVVQDPDLHRDIVSLGFIKNIKIENAKVSFDVELTTPACPVKELLKDQCLREIKKIKGVKEISVNMTAQVRPLVQTGLASLKGIKNIIAVASGKGGVGKSTVAVNLALALAKAGSAVGLMDADIYGPSVPMMLGITERPSVIGNMIQPLEKLGLKVLSMGMLTNDDTPVIWRGPMVAGILQQFLAQVEWGNLDYLVMDLPPGTGDAQLTLAQKAPISGAVIVTTPQDIALLDARRGLKMFQQVQVPVLGIIENMSYFICDGCSKKHHIFRQGGGKRVALELGVPFLGEIPLDTRVADGGDSGKPVLLTNAEAPVSLAYQELAGRVAAALSIMSESKKGTSTELHLKW
ncbi:MAG: iron-sulfur cluster carrier protein ApbC [Deltaproteobacteria bacterium]|nr:iron-sulfur cluster carrier protein ApbC [Deltaproteobacteria bacterium]